MRKRYDLIIFDCDGTLVDSEPVTNGLIAEMIKERGIEITKEECLDRFAGKSLMDIIYFIREKKVHEDEVTFETEYRQRCDEIFKRDLKPIPGVPDLLASLTIPFCVASNGPKVKMDVTLPATELDHFFTEERIFSAYDIQAWKPKPDLFLHAASQMGVPPDRCLVIEDTWSGIMGAINAEIDVWAYNPHLDKRLYQNGVPSFTEMNTIAERLLI